jgi:hypothetical protein
MENAMNTDELRGIIWDALFRANATKSISEIAALTEQDVSEVRAAVNHEWFTVSQDRVSIAMAISDRRADRQLVR